MKMTARLYPLTAALLFLSSCGGGGSSKPLTTDDFCTMKATAECQVVGRCANSMSACVTARQAVCQQFVLSAATLPRVFTPANIGACISRTNAAYSKTTAITPTDMAAIDLACNYVFQGNVALSTACTVQFDCAGRTDGNIICDKTLCANKVTRNLNELCGNPGEVCNTGAYCTTDGAVLRCLAKKALAAACDPAAMPCVEDLRCTSATCMTRVGAGGACTSNDDCSLTTAPYCDTFNNNICDQGLTFAPNSPSCAAYGGSAGAGTGNDAATASDGGGG